MDSLILKLRDLLRQRDEIDEQIKNLLQAPAPAVAPKAKKADPKKKIEEPEEKPKRKWTRRTPKNINRNFTKPHAPELKGSPLNKLECLECKNVFNSVYAADEAFCPRCESSNLVTI